MSLDTTDTLTDAVFCLDIINEVLGQPTPLPGYHRPDEDWNGWATPLFNREQAEQVTAALNATFKLLSPDSWTQFNEDGNYAWFDPETECYCSFNDNESGAIDEWECFVVDIAGTPTKTWAIGSYNWTWCEQVTFHPITEEN